jgi:1,4-dihydroxy-2-naphthoyl-CoA synthase
MVGQKKAREIFLPWAIILAQEAMDMGMVNAWCFLDELEDSFRMGTRNFHKITVAIKMQNLL